MTNDKGQMTNVCKFQGHLIPSPAASYGASKKKTELRTVDGVRHQQGFTPLEKFKSLIQILKRGKIKNKRCSHYKGYRRLPLGNLSLTGFTLIELLLVVVIIGALVAMVMPRLSGRSEQARRTVAEADVKANIATGLKLYELDNGNFPRTEQGLNALLVNPSSAKNWRGPYLETAIIDPWGNEYQYKSPGDHRKDYDLYSLGKDGVESDDDVSNWE